MRRFLRIWAEYVCLLAVGCALAYGICVGSFLLFSYSFPLAVMIIIAIVSAVIALLVTSEERQKRTR